MSDPIPTTTSTIRTDDRLLIRTVSRDDLPVICGWWNNPTVMSGSRSQTMTITVKQLEERYAPSMDRHPSAGAVRQFLVCLDTRPVGEIGYKVAPASGIYSNKDADKPPHTVEVDVKIGDPSLWSQGVGSRSLELFLEYLFDDIGVGRVTGRTRSDHKAAIRLLDRLGFTENTRQPDVSDDVQILTYTVAVDQFRSAMRRGKTHIRVPKPGESAPDGAGTPPPTKPTDATWDGTTPPPTE